MNDRCQYCDQPYSKIDAAHWCQQMQDALAPKPTPPRDAAQLSPVELAKQMRKQANREYGNAAELLEAGADKIDEMLSREPNDLEGFRDAWYEIGALLDIPAMAMSPKKVHEHTVMPLLRAILQNSRRWNHLDNLTYDYGDGYTEPREYHVNLEWVQHLQEQDFPGWNVVIDRLMEKSKCTD